MRNYNENENENEKKKKEKSRQKNFGNFGKECVMKSKEPRNLGRDRNANETAENSLTVSGFWHKSIVFARFRRSLLPIKHQTSRQPPQSTAAAIHI